MRNSKGLFSTLAYFTMFIFGKDATLPELDR